MLARADVGIAMGGLGSDAAIEAADVVIMNDQPSKIAEAIHLAKKTLKIVKQNIVFAIGIKILVLALGAFGFASMGDAVFADVGVTVCSKRTIVSFFPFFTIIAFPFPSTTVEPQLLQARGVGERTASTTNVFFF
ncbi:hypothetical protein EfmJHP35_20210 [Enterococcus faecium]|nr:hypothetical protein EfmJHP35_20210 [Enterococcus faecium]